MASPTDDELEKQRDALFLSDTAPLRFEFDDQVAAVLPDMLRRSIPGYSTLLQMLSVLAGEHLPAGGVVYDLGCSLGAASLAVRHGLGARQARIIAIDNSKAMVERCRAVISADSGLCPVDVQLGDIASLELAPCDLVVANFSLQFVPPSCRERVLSEIYAKLKPGGLFVLSEKTCASVAREQAFFQQTHDAFRRSNGYSQIELSRKREALEKVLLPLSAADQEAMLKRCGFKCTLWFRCLQFVSWVGQKPKAPGP